MQICSTRKKKLLGARDVFLLVFVQTGDRGSDSVKYNAQCSLSLTLKRVILERCMTNEGCEECTAKQSQLNAAETAQGCAVCKHCSCCRSALPVVLFSYPLIRRISAILFIQSWWYFWSRAYTDVVILVKITMQNRELHFHIYLARSL